MCTKYARKILSDFVIERIQEKSARVREKREHFSGRCKNQEINFLFFFSRVKVNILN